MLRVMAQGSMARRAIMALMSCRVRSNGEFSVSEAATYPLCDGRVLVSPQVSRIRSVIFVKYGMLRISLLLATYQSDVHDIPE